MPGLQSARIRPDACRFLGSVSERQGACVRAEEDPPIAFGTPSERLVTDFVKLPLRLSRSVFNVVIETPRGSPVKLDYDTKHRVFAYGHPLMLGLRYPFDWGFFPRTRAQDGDPLDALVLHESATYPGVVIGCRLIGVVRLTEKQAKKSRIRNDRLICVPDAAANYSDARDVPRALQKELEHFFAATAELVKKTIRIDGWRGPKGAKRLLAQHEIRKE